jgi:FeS assembly protein IscX
MAGATFHWLDVDLIGEKLAEAHPSRDPLTVRFVELRRLVEALPGFKEQPGHPVNERILETIQQQWHEEYTDAPREDDD